MQRKIPLTILVGSFVVAVAMVVMHLQSKVPEWADERPKQMMMVFGKEVGCLLAYPVSWLTGAHYLRAFRSVTSFFIRTPDLNSPDVKISPTQLDGVAAKLFRPLSTPDLSPALIFIHGGGWSILEADVYDRTCYRMALKFNVVVASVDYRQAPDHPYPVPFEDCVRATVHVMREAKSMGIDPQRIAIAGDSAGGNLAAAVSLRLSQEDLASTLPPLKFQVLIYPALQMVDLNTPSYTNFTSTGPLTRDLMAHMWLTYLHDLDLAGQQSEVEVNAHSLEILLDPAIASCLNYSRLPRELQLSDFEPVRPKTGGLKLSAKAKSTILDPYFSPLLAKDVSMVPPAYFVIANIDVLRDDGLLYAERLREAGVATEVDFYRGMPHTFFMVPPVDGMMYERTREALDKLAKYVGEHL